MGQHSRLAAEGLKQCDSHRPFNLEVREGARGLCCHRVEMVRQQQMVSSEWSLHQDSQVSDLGSAIDQGRTHSHFLRLLQQITRDLAAWNNADLSSYGSGGQKSKKDLTGLKTRYPQGRSSFWRFSERICFLGFSVFQGLRKILSSGPLPFPKSATAGGVFLTNIMLTPASFSFIRTL